MYLLIELFSSLMSHLGRESAPAAVTPAGGDYHVAPDATLS